MDPLEAELEERMRTDPTDRIITEGLSFWSSRVVVEKASLDFHKTMLELDLDPRWRKAKEHMLQWQRGLMNSLLEKDLSAQDIGRTQGRVLQLRQVMATVSERRQEIEDIERRLAIAQARLLDFQRLDERPVQEPQAGTS